LRISIVTGFFLPVPATKGGATERSWYGLATLFAAHGHQVTFVSRRLAPAPAAERQAGVEHVRVRGFDHTRHLWLNLLLDFLWGLRVGRALPPADIVILNTITLPVWIGTFRPECGTVAVMIGRTPRAQVWLYGGVARIYVPSGFVADQIIGPAARAKTVAIGYPIDWRLQAKAARQDASPIVIGYAGRLHPEKGLELLVRAALLLRSRSGLPAWRLRVMGPSRVDEGGAGEEWLKHLKATAAPLGDAVEWLGPEFAPAALAAAYGRMDVFCYPSLAIRGETFGVAVAEAMAAGCAVTVSALECFRELVTDGETGLVFNQSRPDADRQLADSLARLLADPALRRRLAASGQGAARRFDYARMADTLLADFTVLTGEARENPHY
jgi:glycosyltransferase involved in cell wall biosynthesis